MNKIGPSWGDLRIGLFLMITPQIDIVLHKLQLQRHIAFTSWTLQVQIQASSSLKSYPIIKVSASNASTYTAENIQNRSPPPSFSPFEISMRISCSAPKNEWTREICKRRLSGITIRIRTTPDTKTSGQRMQGVPWSLLDRVNFVCLLDPFGK